ncbi:MAG: 4-hydroxyphenylacetate 3-hydroxylase N-terminal domain-containing protein [Thermodesulfobacteriota bacterium]
MALKAPEEYKKSIRQLKVNAYLDGRKVENLLENAVTRSVIEATAKIYELALDPEHEQVMTAISHLTGEKINRNLHVNQSAQDLEKRAEMALLTSQTLGTCNYRCVGCDAINALASVTLEMDQKKGTSYAQRFRAFLERVQKDDLAVSGAVTDAKGDRSKRILEGDPDMYVHIVAKKSDGIIVRGAKLHQSGAFCAQETVVIPGGALRKGEENYAVAFSIPNSAPGIAYILQYNALSVEREQAADIFHLGNPYFGQRETCLMVFDNVFIPYENVFMCGEVEFAGPLVQRFAKIHRMNCGGACKVGFADIIIGAAQLAAEYAGVDKAPHIRESITKMIRLAEAAHACAIAAAIKGQEEPPGSGIYTPDDLFGNVAKLTTAYGFWEIMALAGDIAGGLVVTMPSFKELQNPATKDYIVKYLQAAAPAEKRMRIIKVLQNWTAGLHGPSTWHGAGSPQAQMISLFRAANLEEKKMVAKRIAGITD